MCLNRNLISIKINIYLVTKKIYFNIINQMEDALLYQYELSLILEQKNYLRLNFTFIKPMINM